MDDVVIAVGFFAFLFGILFCGSLVLFDASIDGEIILGERFVRVDAEQEEVVEFKTCEEMFCEDVTQEANVNGWWNRGWTNIYRCKIVWRRC